MALVLEICSINHATSVINQRRVSEIKSNTPDELVTTEMQPTRLQSRMRAAAVVAGVFAIAVGLGVWAGWWAGIEVMKRVFPGMIAMNPLTALCVTGGGARLSVPRE